MHRLLAVAAALSLSGSALAAEAPKTQLTWHGHAAFLLKTPKGLSIAIDPWLSNPTNPDKGAAKKVAKLDYILVSHAHTDHVGDAVELGKRTGAKLVSIFEVANALAGAGFPKDQATMATAGNIGGTIALGDEVKVTLVPAVHSSTFQKTPTGPAEPAGNPVGFVIEIKDGPTLYHAGDTDVTGDMGLVGQRFAIDVMLAPIGGHFTMGPRGAALAASLVKPRQIVPMHFGTYPVLTGTPAQLRSELVAKSVEVTLLEMKPGETRTF